jgi:hypothetical protein
MAVVEQPPKGGGDVTIPRNSSRMCVHLAVLFVCHAYTLYVMDQSAITAWNSTTIYGNSRILYV